MLLSILATNALLIYYASGSSASPASSSASAALPTTTTLFALNGRLDSFRLLVSFIDQDATATTWAVTCPAPTVTLRTTYPCDYLTPGTMTVGPSTYKTSASSNGVHASIGCVLNGNTGATCSGSATYPTSYSPTTQTFYTVLDAAQMQELGYKTATITDHFPSPTSMSTGGAPRPTAEGMAKIRVLAAVAVVGAVAAI